MYRQQARQQAREKLMQLFYQMDMNSDFSALQKELFLRTAKNGKRNNIT